MYSKSRRYILFMMLGFTTLASQIIILRQLMIVFGGNELTLGLALASWMIWMGLSNILVGRFSDRLKRLDLVISIVATLLALIFPATLIFTSLIKPILGIPVAEMVDLAAILVITILILGPLCFIDGMFLNIMVKTGGRDTSVDIGEVYLFDALGSALGGILFGWIAIEFLNPFVAMTILSILLLTAVIYVSSNKMALIPAAAMAAVVVLLICSANINRAVQRIVWKGYNPVVNLDTKFQNIVVTDNHGEFTLFSDGLPVFTIPDKAAYETTAHLAALESAAPKNILVIGGGISGISQELNKYSPEAITYLQIDPEITRLETDIMGGKIPDNVRIIHRDGRYFLNRFNRATNAAFDVIILNIGDPTNSATNRYYTEEFFELAKKALTKSGLLFMGVYQTSNYISKDALKLLSILNNTLEDVFNNVVIIPLDKYYFVASQTEGILSNNVDELTSRLEKSGISTDIFAPEVLYGTFQSRIDGDVETIKEASLESSRLNTDSQPIAYFTSIAIWGQKFGAETGRIFDYLSRADFKVIIWIILATGLLSLGLSRKIAYLPVLWSLFSAGWAGITTELLILIKYQVEIGMLFYNIGFIITAFMVGVSLGAFVAIHTMKKFRPSHLHLLILLFALGLYVLSALKVTNVSFILANFIVAFIVGLIYQTAAEITVKLGVGKTAGILNGADYMGSAAGSLIASGLTIPLFGLGATVYIMLVVIAVPIIHIFFKRIFLKASKII